VGTCEENGNTKLGAHDSVDELLQRDSLRGRSVAVRDVNRVSYEGESSTMRKGTTRRTARKLEKERGGISSQ